MRLITAHLRDYRLHRDLAVTFDPRLTVISGPNQSGKSTLAEALHRALFLPVKTGGALLEGMRTDPFMADPDMELVFDCAGQIWTLRKRFAGNRGSVSLQDSRGRSLQGDAAEERLAELIGTAAVARNRGAADQLKERWGHLWVWQGSSSSNPLALSSEAYDHDRLVERLQAGADLGVQSPLDLAVVEDIQQRWAEVYTAGGVNREPQVKRGSALQLASSAVVEAQGDLDTITDRIAQQSGAEQVFQAATEQVERIIQELPLLQQQRQELDGRLSQSQALESEIAKQQPLHEAVGKELIELNQDLKLVEELSRKVADLEAAKAPDTEKLTQLQQQLPEFATARQQAQHQLEVLQKNNGLAAATATAIEGRQTRLRLLQEQERLRSQLSALECIQARKAELERDLEQLPAMSAADVEHLRGLDAGLRAAQVRAESLAAGIEVIRAGQTVLLDGEALAAGSSRLLVQPAVLQVGDDVQLRLLPGGGTSASEASQALEAAQQRLSAALQRWKLGSLEEAATAERRRSDLIAEQERLLEQVGSSDATTIRQRLEECTEGLEALAVDPEDGSSPAADALEVQLAELEGELRQARQARAEATQAEQAQQQLLQQCSVNLEIHKQAIEAAGLALRERENQLLEARTRVDSVLQRRGTREALQGALTELEQRLAASQLRLDGLKAELAALDPANLKQQSDSLDQRINALTQEMHEARETRIRAEGRLHGDGQVDLKAELEQKQAELESRVLEQERLKKEAAMLTLLRRLLEEEQNAMASQYTAPIISRVERYLAEVFPEAPEPSLSYNARNGFQELQWRQRNEAAFGFDVLSTGAREQFAAALRIAMAEVLAEAYEGSLPLLFDDAFANSDPERQKGIHRMLQQAADQGLQVILLTCDPERSHAIEGAAHLDLAGDYYRLL